MPQFLCFDLQRRKLDDADLVEAMNPEHACQEFVAAVDSGNNEIAREPYLIACRFADGDPNTWGVFRVTPKMSVSYEVSIPSAEEIRRPREQQVQRPVITRPPAPKIPNLDVRPFPTDLPPDALPGDPSLYPE